MTTPHYDTGNVLNIAWWNTSLSPRAKQTDTTDSRWATAESTVKSLLLDGKADLLGLAEVTPADIERLRASCGTERSLRSLTDDRAVKDGGRDVGLIYDFKKLELIKQHFRIDLLGDKQLSSGIEVTFSITATQSLLQVFLVHWPSRRMQSAADERRTLGHELQRRIQSTDHTQGMVYSVVIGDFNDEPFDASLTAGLLGSRDRTLVRKKTSRLYNPFWRILGEQRHQYNDNEINIAGTYHYSSNPDTHWYTFDQALVSASLLGDNPWMLLESETRVFHGPPLTNNKGKPTNDFDHLPIAITLLLTNSTPSTQSSS